ncbi:glucokinase [Candidatus Binatia bacterium]|nr:glucokinase [Candidatus Binatia bacterium]
MILAGDLGGTKVLLALFDVADGRLRPVRDAAFSSQHYATFDALLAEFLGASASVKVSAACFAAAGPVVDGVLRTTNLPWVLAEPALSERLGTQRVRLLNDLQGTAYGVIELPAADLCALQGAGRPRRNGNIAVVAAGTGLGEAMLIWDGARYLAVASEGGHTDFAPRNDREIALLRYLREQGEEHVSYERVLSGPGLHNIYNFLRDSGFAPEPAALAQELQSGDPSATVARHALAGDDPLCVAALDTFCAIYGAEAGNLALKCLAVEVAVAGGIAPKILPALQSGGFMASFVGKGRFADRMRGIGVNIVLNPRAALLGAAHCAMRL